MHGAKGPIFEDGPSFDMAFKLFHGKDGVIPLSERSDFHNGRKEADSQPAFNPLAGKVATISLSAFGLGGPFNFGNFSDKWKKQKNSDSSNKKDHSSQVKTCLLMLVFPISYGLIYTHIISRQCFGSQGKIVMCMMFFLSVAY